MGICADCVVLCSSAASAVKGVLSAHEVFNKPPAVLTSCLLLCRAGTAADKEREVAEILLLMQNELSVQSKGRRWGM